MVSASNPIYPSKKGSFLWNPFIEWKSCVNIQCIPPVNNNKYSNIKVYSLKIVCKVNIKDNDSKIIGINCDRVLILYIKNIITTMK